MKLSRLLEEGDLPDLWSCVEVMGIILDHLGSSWQQLAMMLRKTYYRGAEIHIEVPPCLRPK